MSAQLLEPSIQVGQAADESESVPDLRCVTSKQSIPVALVLAQCTPQI